MSNHEPSKNLTVYRASAGSGKTHQLTAEYLKLLFASPYAYRHILAVTFTNKATDEMKTRIIAELAKLSSGKDSGYIEELTTVYSINEKQLREKAHKTLVLILHDYSAFSISTIDRFFQQTMRAFARELGLGGGYNVELDTTKVLKESIDSMLYDLERKENKQLLDWLIRFSEEKIENGETWNIRKDIQTLSSEIFKESYKAFSDELQKDIADKGLLDDYKKELSAYIHQFEKASQTIAEKALNIMERHNLKADNFKGESRSTFFSFHKWVQGEIKHPTATFCKLPNEVSNWHTKKTEASIISRIEDAYNDGLNECVQNIITHYENTQYYQTAYEINRYYFTLGILSDIDRKIREYAAENNIMLISDTTELLHKIIQGDDTPFIYEKVGTRIDNYMIDEFQDTSRMQWLNFSPLIKNSLANGNKNLIVGDIKQSIYRWRNSDWNLLDEQLDIDFKMEGINHQSLDTNWRSSKNVVDFNNTIFSASSKILQQLFNESLPDSSTDERIAPLNTKIERAYKEAFQELPQVNASNIGRVNINFIDTEEHNDWYSHVLTELPKTIENLQDRGYSLKDIAILVRTKKEGADIANCLLQYKGEHPDSKYKYDIISDEALFLSNARSIKLIISLMKYLRNPADTSLRALAIYEYYKFKNQLTAEEALQKHFSIDYEFPDEIKSQLTKIRELPIYEMAEEIFSLFREATDSNENIYIQSFLDSILDFTIRSNSDLDAFLQWWDESGIKKTIFTPDSQDAIRIMTIHKSKGLGFNVTIVPFCHWDLDHKLSTILWCHPQIEPFNRLHLVPVKYSQKLSNTIFEYEYYNEKMHVFIDNLNVLYVAFTRAKNELITFSPKPKPRKNSDVKDISSLLWYTINNSTAYLGDSSDRFINLPKLVDTEKNLFEIGHDYRSTKKTKSDTNQITIKSLPSISFNNRLSLRLNNKYFFAPDGSREYGTMMHDIISKVNTLSDLDHVVEQYYISGDISSAEKSHILSILTDYLSNPALQSWYSGEYRILNEVQILLPKGTFVRPDRVMVKKDEAIVIDYKFGEKEDKKYLKQVNYYMGYIKKMGYKRVSGFLFYVSLNKIIEVE